MNNTSHLYCEHDGCESKDARDYHRLIPEDVYGDAEGELTEQERREWEDEPIALCEKHAGIRAPFNPKP